MNYKTRKYLHSSFAVTGLTNKNQQVFFDFILFVKSVTAWVCNLKDSLRTLDWPELYEAL